MLQCTTNVLLWFLLRPRFNSGEPRARTYVPCLWPPGWTCRPASDTRRDLSTGYSSRTYVNRGVMVRRRIITRQYRGFPSPLAQTGRAHRSASMHVATHVRKRDADARAYRRKINTKQRLGGSCGRARALHDKHAEMGKQYHCIRAKRCFRDRSVSPPLVSGVAR